MLVVLDTNVLVSALLSPFGAPARVLDLVLVGDIQLAYDDRILSEYREVLGRPRLGLPPQVVGDLLEYLLATGEPVTSRPLRVKLPDPDDLPFLEVAAEARAPLVTGNPTHYGPAAQCGVAVFTPNAFLAHWRSG